MVRFCGSGRLMPLRMSVMRSCLAMTVAFLFPDLLEALAAQTGGGVRAAALLEGVDRRVDDVVRVRGPDALGENVLDARHLEHRPHRAAGDDAGPGAGRPQEH